MRKFNVVLAIIACLGFVQNCHAGLIVLAPEINASPGQSGAFDLLIQSTDGSFRVAADTIELSLSGLAGVTFTDVTILTSIPYSYVDPGVSNGGGPFSLDTFPNTNFIASDSEFGIAGFVQIDPGMQFGIARVSFEVNAGAAFGDRRLIFGDGTSLADIDADLIDFTKIEGAIRVVPEPATASLLSAGLICTFVHTRKRATGTQRRPTR